MKPLVEWKTYFRLWVSKDATKLVFLNTENLPMWRRNQIVSRKISRKVGRKTPFSADFLATADKEGVQDHIVIEIGKILFDIGAAKMAADGEHGLEIAAGEPAQSVDIVAVDLRQRTVGFGDVVHPRLGDAGPRVLERTITTSPMEPALIIRFASAKERSNRRIKAICSFTPLTRAARSMRPHSSTVMTMGFSHRMCSLALAAISQ